jgi:two-component system chemotaxis sensor kinase CheA
VLISSDAITTSLDGVEIANVTVSVNDEGVGISKEDQTKLFDNFVQLRPGSIQKGQGSGLGLSFCKQIVEFHGGTISITSTEGNGSSFTFTIPFAIANSVFESCSESIKVNNTRISSPPGMRTLLSRETPSFLQGERKNPDDSTDLQIYDIEAPKVAKVSALSSMKVLVVDDAVSNRKLLMMLLTKKGLISHAAEDGQLAVDLILADMDAYTLVFIDNLMPVMNGSDATKALRTHGYPYLIVGITGNSMEDDIAEFLSSGADIVIPKPFNKFTLDLLVKHIEKYGTLSQPSMKLVQGNNSMNWLSRF